MNISILALISSSFLSKSPFFVSNQMNVMNCNFQRFTALLFYNQQSLNLYNSNFQKGLGGIISIDKDLNALFKTTKEYDSTYKTYFRIVNSVDEIKEQLFFQNKDYKAACSITYCKFHDITVQSNPIFRFANNISTYFSDILIYNCVGKQDLIKFEQSRCNTMTHICSFENTVESGADFCHSDFRRTDFFILTYSTIVGNSNTKSNYVINSRFGSHYHRCLNFTNIYKVDNDARLLYDIDAPHCYSHAFISFNNVKRDLYRITGSIKDSSIVQDGNQNLSVYFDSICAYNQIEENFFYLGLHSGNSFFLIVSNSVFVSGYGKYFLKFNEPGGNNINNYIMLENCQFSNNLNCNGETPKSFFIDYNSFVQLDVASIKTPELAHYTTLFCRGIEKENKPTIAYGCNVDSCLAEKQCNSTIGFPEDVAPYTTIIHQGLQTLSFTPSVGFTHSNSFSFSFHFTDSDHFTKSSFFTRSNNFSSSNVFTETSHFSRSSFFSKSNLFSESSPLTASSHFTSSVFFSKSNFFSETSPLTQSSNFTYSSFFSSSAPFSVSSYFSNSKKFSKSEVFSNTQHFSNSIEFSNSNQFSFSYQFSETNMFSESNLFSKSDVFSPSKHFDATNTFTPSNNFSESSPLTESSQFTYSSFFSSSSNFSYSSYFSETKEFSKSTQFSSSFYFSDSKKFTFSCQFSESGIFTRSDSFTKSGTFTPSNHFDATNTFSPSSGFTPSHIFTTSDYFSKSEKFTSSFYFTNTKQFSETKEFTSSHKFTSSDNYNATHPFTPSSSFTSSKEFTQSSLFSMSLTIRDNVVININQNTQSKTNWKLIGGVLAAVGSAVALGVILIAFFIIRRRRFQPSSDMFEELNPIESGSTSVTYNNALRNFDMEDDPFEDDFHID